MGLMDDALNYVKAQLPSLLDKVIGDNVVKLNGEVRIHFNGTLDVVKVEDGKVLIHRDINGDTTIPIKSEWATKKD